MAKAKIGITIDENLLPKLDEFCDENFIGRSTVISLALNQYLNSQAVSKAIFDMSFSLKKIAEKGVVDGEAKKQLAELEKFCSMFSA